MPFGFGAVGQIWERVEFGLERSHRNLHRCRIQRLAHKQGFGSACTPRDRTNTEESQIHTLGHRAREQLHILGQVADAAASGDDDLAAGDLDDPGDGLHQRGLAGAVVAGHANAQAGVYAQLGPLQGQLIGGQRAGQRQALDAA